jgi:hypothetical protein
VTPDDVLPAVVDVDPVWCEDGLTLHCYQTHANRTVTLWTFTLGAPIGKAQTPPYVIEGM